MKQEQSKQTKWRALAFAALAGMSLMTGCKDNPGTAPAQTPASQTPATAPAPAPAQSTPATTPTSAPVASVPTSAPATLAATTSPASAAPVATPTGAAQAVIDQPVVPLGEWPMWGLTPHRNMVSPEKNPPTDWDVATGKNILWVQKLGSLSNGNPMVAQGIVTVGTNNEGHRDPTQTADGGVEMAFDAVTGKFLWQKYYSKLPTGRVNDWPQEGLCAVSYSEPGKLWYCTNQCHVVCLDLSPGATKLPDGSPPVLWDYDMIAKLGVFPHNMTSSSIASWGDYIYVITGNGVDDTHKHVVSPDAPGIVCFDKNTGKVIWTDNVAGPNVLHGQWSSVAIAEVNGRPLVIAPLGDSWVYAYDARTGKQVWRFDMNPKDTVYPSTRNEVISTPCIVGKYMYIPNGQDPEHGEGPGHMYCVDITGEGDVSAEIDANANAAKPKPGEELLAEPAQVVTHKGKPNPNSKLVWEFDFDHTKKKPGRGDQMHRSISTATVTPEGLCFVSDFSGFVHCFDAITGELLWTHDLMGEIWGSAMYADGKLFVADGNGDVAIFPASRKQPGKADIIMRDMGGPCYCSPVLVNGILYIMTHDHLYAIKQGAQSTPPKEE